MILTRDLKVKGTTVTRNRGTLVKNLRLTDTPGHSECDVDMLKELVLTTALVRKA